MELDAGSEDLRARAMNERNPVHSMLFCHKGALLTANAAALQGISSRPPGSLKWPHLPLRAPTAALSLCFSS